MSPRPLPSLAAVTATATATDTAPAASPAPAPSLVRLRLTPPERGPHRIDGVWWPRSEDLVVELPGLLGALPHNWTPILHVTVNDAGWSEFPGRMLVSGRALRLHRATAQHAPPTICLLAPGKGRWDLLVVPPDTGEPEATRLMAAAASTGAGR